MVRTGVHTHMNSISHLIRKISTTMDLSLSKFLWIRNYQTRGPRTKSLTRETSSFAQSYDCVIHVTLIWRGKIHHISNGWIVLICKALKQDALCQVWLKLAQWFWRKRFIIYMHFHYFVKFYLPLEKGVTLYLSKLESIHYKCFVPKL